MFRDPHNTFRPNDAFEYVDAYRHSVATTPASIRDRLVNLNERMNKIEGRGEAIPTYLLAAYRGHEDALAFVLQGILPGVVKLDDTDPTRCEFMTPEGYAHV